jgi:hypothetical protein
MSLERSWAIPEYLCGKRRGDKDEEENFGSEGDARN